MRIARITCSDRAATGVYPDLGGPAIELFFEERLAAPIVWSRTLIPDVHDEIVSALRRSVEEESHLVVTTGGTGPSARDVTPEATRSILERELPGFGEIMRIASFAHVKTAILSRAIAGSRGRTLILNLPGNPNAVRECLALVFPAILEALDHLWGIRFACRPSASEEGAGKFPSSDSAGDA